MVFRVLKDPFYGITIFFPHLDGEKIFFTIFERLSILIVRNLFFLSNGINLIGDFVEPMFILSRKIPASIQMDRFGNIRQLTFTTIFERLSILIVRNLFFLSNGINLLG